MLFRQGHGDQFSSAEAALAYAEIEMDKLLAECEELAAEDFDGIYCEHLETGNVWMFDYQNGATAWIPDEGDVIRRSATILPFLPRAR